MIYERICALLVAAILPIAAQPLYGFTDRMVAEGVKAEDYQASIWRTDIKDHNACLPSAFRTCFSALSAENAKDGMNKEYIPSGRGLSGTKMSGSGQFDEAQMDNIASEIRQYHDGDICIVDIRQESHLLINGESFSRYADRDWGNLGKDRNAVTIMEAELVETVTGESIEAYTLDENKNPEKPVTITAESVRTEKEAAEAHGFEYYRLPCTDHVCPTPEVIDDFISFVKTLDDDTWLHFHCEGGKGRTTFFMALYDILQNPDVSLKDIAYRQCEIGGNYILTASDESWKSPYYAEKTQNVELIYQYAQENHDTGYTLSYSEWLSQTGGK